MAGERILLVEDNSQNRRLAEFLLKSRGYMVYEATTGQEALELARTLLPDLILMDLRLPGMDGLTATKILKADDLTRRIPVIAMTAFAMQGDREKALKAGCDAYITKPIDARNFAATVTQYLKAIGGKREQPGHGGRDEDSRGGR
jgi:CheY-like chemotaxis protein